MSHFSLVLLDRAKIINSSSASTEIFKNDISQGARRQQLLINYTERNGSTISGLPLLKVENCLKSGQYILVTDEPKSAVDIIDKPVIYFPVKSSQKSFSPQRKTSVAATENSGEQKVLTSNVDTRSKKQAVKSLFVRRKLPDAGKPLRD